MKEQCNVFFLSELLNSRDRLKNLATVCEDKKGFIKNAIDCFDHLISNIETQDINQFDILKDCINYCSTSFYLLNSENKRNENMQARQNNQVQNNSQVDVSVNNSERIKIDLLPNIPYTKGFLNFKYKKDLDFETEKSLAILLNYKGADYIYFHPKSIKLNYEQLGIKQGNNYKLYKIVDRATKQKVCVGTISSDEFASMVLSQ